MECWAVLGGARGESGLGLRVLPEGVWLAMFVGRVLAVRALIPVTKGVLEEHCFRFG